MSLKERMADAELKISTPLCQICKNQLKHSFDNQHPEKPIMTCSALGRIPRDILLARAHECERFELDEAKYKIYKALLPAGFIPGK